MRSAIRSSARAPIGLLKISFSAFVLLFAAALPLHAQMTQRPATAQDRRPNDPRVPDAYALSGQFDRIVVMRMKYNTDLLAGLQKLVKQEHIENGVILSGIGSVRGYHVHQVATRDFPSLDIYSKALNTPADLVSMNGYIVHGQIHAHLTLGTHDKAIAGHLEPGTQVFTFAIVTVGVMNGTDLARIDDETYR